MTIPTLPELQAAEAHYAEALELKTSRSKRPSSHLSDLDAELCSTFASADTDGLTSKALLRKVLDWKLARGKFRPTLPKLVDANDPETVERCVREALGMVRACQSSEDALASGAVQKLAELKGVGPATASAFLSFLPPHHLPFFSDEAAGSFPTLLPLKYTIAQYKAFVELMSSTLAGLPKGWDMRRLERATYAAVVLRREGRADLLADASSATAKRPSLQQQPDASRRKKRKTG